MLKLFLRLSLLSLPFALPADARWLVAQPASNALIAPSVAHAPALNAVVQRANGKALIDWSGIQVRLAKSFPAAKLKTFRTSIYVNGVETVKDLPSTTTRYRFNEPLNRQIDYYIVTKDGSRVVDISEYTLSPTNDGQNLAPESFRGQFAGEHFEIHYPEGWGLSDALTKTSVRLGYQKIVWVLAPTAKTKVRQFVTDSKTGVDVTADYGADGVAHSFLVKDRSTNKTITASPKDFYDKVDAAFNGNAFFWDDMFVSLATVPYHPTLAQATLRFWLMVQNRNGGVIPREVRKVNLLSFWFKEWITDGHAPKINLIYTNPYLMDWTMDALYRFDPSTENLALLKEVSRSIDEYTAWMEKFRSIKNKSGQIVGFTSSALGSGLDNSRGMFGNYGEPEAYRAGFIDTISQQVAMLKSQTRWNKIFAERSVSAAEKKRFLTKAARSAKAAETYAKVINDFYWNEDAGFYFDLIPAGDELIQRPKYYSIAGFWPLYAGVVTGARLDRFIQKQMTPEAFGGDFPFPANARHAIDPNEKVLYKPRIGFRNEDGYWDKWAHWPNIAMVAIEGFRRSGRPELAHQLTTDYLKKMAEASPKTVDENYGEIEVTKSDGSKTFKPRPGQHSDHKRRTDFAGWGKGPPIYLALVDAVGLDASSTGTLTWSLFQEIPAGQNLEVRNLQFRGHNIERLTLRQSGGGLELEVLSDQPLTIEVKARGRAESFTLPGAKTPQKREVRG